MGARRRGRAGGTSRTPSTLQARAAARSSLLRGNAPAVLLIIGLLLLTGAILAAAPAAHAGPLHDTHTWTGEADGSSWSQASNWAGGQLPSDGDSLVFPSPELGETYADGQCVNDDFLTSVGSVTIGTEGYENQITVGGSALLVDGPIVAYGANTWGMASTTASSPLVIQNNTYVPPPPDNPDDPIPEFYSTLAITGDVQLVHGGVGQPLTLSFGDAGGTNDTIAVTGDIDGADPDCNVTVDGYGAVTFSGTDTWGGDVTSENGVVHFYDPASLPATSAVHLGTSDYSYGMAFFDFSGHSGTYTMPNVFSGQTGISFRNAKVDLTGDSSGFSGHVWVPEYDAGTAATDVTVTGKVGGTIALASHGTLRGAGTVHDVGAGGDNTAGDISPGATDSSVGVLHTTGRVHPFNGMSYTVDMTDAYGAAGIGHDYLDIGGDLWLGYVSTGGQWVVRLRSGVGGASNFDPAAPYTWNIMHVGGTVSWFAPSDFRVDTGGFHNATQGIFSVGQAADETDGGTFIQLTYKPVRTLTWTGASATSSNWSDPDNWDGDTAPGNGDSLVFPAWMSHAVNDDFLTSVGSVDLGTASYVGGSAVTISGSITAHMDDDSSPMWDVPTTLTGDTTLRLTPIGNPTGAPMAIGQDISLQDGAGAGHTLTVDAGDASRATMYGQLTGSDGDCSLVKQGTGTFKLGGDGWWSGSDTWAGPTDVQAGCLRIAAPGALSSHTDVHISGGATLTAELWNYPWDPVTRDVWSNEFTGDGGIEIDYGDVTFTGTSPSFAGTLTDHSAATIATGAVLGGTADAASGGTLYGLGAVQDLTVDSGATVNPGLGDFGVGQLTASREVGWNGGGTYAVDVTDAAGAAGSGYDSLAIGGARPGLTLAGSEATPFTIFLVSSDGSTAARCAHFDNTQTRRWHVATLSSGGISGWDAATDVKVDSTQFATYNDLGGGTFSAEPSADGASVDVVFTPAHTAGPVAGFGNALACGSGYLNAPNSGSVSFGGSSDYSVEMWVRPHGGSDNNTTLFRQRDGGDGTLESWFAITKDDMLFCGIQNYAYPGWFWLGFDHQLPQDAWSHVAMTKDGDTLHLYIDGRQVDGRSVPEWVTEALPSGAPLTFGGDALEGNHVRGDLDEIQVYDRCLSGTDVADTYNRGLGQSLGLGSGPVRYYELNETEGTSAADSGSDGVDATLTDMGAAPWIESRAAREFTSDDGHPALLALAYGDPATQDLTVSVVDEPEHGSVDLTLPSLGRGGYIPDAGWTGTDTFTYRVSDGTSTSPAVTAWVDVTGPDAHAWDGGGATDDWSDAANWVGDALPSNRDTLYFPQVSRPTAVNDDFLTDVNEIAVGHGMDVSGSGVGLSGQMTLGRDSTWGVAATTLQADVRVLITITSSPQPHATLGGDFNLLSGTTGAHTLTVENVTGSIVHTGQITGTDAGCGLVKQGGGSLALGVSSEGSWAGTNTWGGPTDVEGGLLRIEHPDALSSHTGSLAIAAGAEVLAAFPEPSASAVWSPEISGDGRFEVGTGSVTLTAASAGFTGNATVDEGATLTATGSWAADTVVGGLLRGAGTVGSLTAEATGALSPGPGDYEAGTLTGGGMALLKGGSSYVCDVSDVDALPGVGYDLLHLSGDLTFAETEDSPVTVVLRSGAGGAAAPAAGFDRKKPYRWIVAATATSINGFSADAVKLDTTGFVAQNPVGAGTFALELTEHGSGATAYQSLDVVYTPAERTVTWDGGGGDDKWSTAANWVGDQAPSDGDSLVFPDGFTADTPHNDALLTSVGSISLGNGDTIDGSGVTMKGGLTVVAGSTDGLASTTLGADLTITMPETPDRSGPVGEAYITGDVRMVDGAGAAHALTVNVGDWSYLHHKGVISGADPACTLTKTGWGQLLLGDAAGWTGPNTWAGATSLQGGATMIKSPGALSQNSDVSLGASATLHAAMTQGTSDTWGNVFSGWGLVAINQWSNVTLTAALPDLKGGLDPMNDGRVVVTKPVGSRVDASSRGELAGTGPVKGAQIYATGIVSPGVADYNVATMALDGNSMFGFGGKYPVDITDAAAAAGTGYDTATVNGTLTVNATLLNMDFVVRPRSSDGVGSAHASHFDATKPYRWHIVTTTGGVTGFTPEQFTVDASGFTNATNGGSFSVGLSADEKSLDLIFTPLADFSEGPTVGDGGGEFLKGSTQTVAWEMDQAPPAGSVFKVVADDPGSATDVLLATIPATGETAYSYDWTIAQGPSAGWHVAVQLWSGSGDSAVQYRTKDSQTFDIIPAEYTIRPSVTGTPAHGTISPSTDQTVPYKATPTFTFSPADGYHVKEVKVDGQVVEMTGDDQYTFPAVIADHTISVEFTIDTFAITVTAGDHGTIEPGTGRVDYGSSPKYTITADTGYHVVDVVADGRSLGVVPDVTFLNVANDHTLSATFAVDEFDITPSVVGGSGGHGAISPAEKQTVGWHTNPTFTFSPAEGYLVKDVRVDDQVVTMTGTNAYTFPAVTADHTISVEFMLQSCLITVTPGANGSITPGTGNVDYGSSPTYAITPAQGYGIADVVVDGESVGAVTSYQFTNVTAAHTIAASFAVNPSGAPTTTVSGATPAWVNHPVTMTFTGHPGASGSPIAFTEYSVAGGQWIQGTSCTVSAEGVSTVQYRSQDQAGVLEDPAKQATVRIDTRKPRVKARPLRARPGRVVRVRYDVKDPLPTSGSALVRLVVRTAAGRVMTRSSSNPVSVNRWLKIRVSTYAIHAPGVYTVSLRAKDLAGNWQRGWTRVRMTVR